jgi:hypothetical protein
MSFGYDLVVAYRVYPKFSNAYLKISRYFNFKTKFDLFHACLLSFKEATKGLKLKMFAILDKCPEIYIDVFKDTFKEVEFYFINKDLKRLENVATFLIQTKLLSKQNLSPLVLFQEDDYFYINKLNYAIDFLKEIKEADVISPEFQFSIVNTPWRRFVKDVIKFKNFDWIKIPSTTCTFLARKKYVIKAKQYLKNYSLLGDLGISLLSTKNLSIFRFDLPYYRYRVGLFLNLIANRKYTLLKEYVFNKKFNFFMPNPSIAIHLNPVSINNDRIKIINEFIKRLY